MPKTALANESGHSSGGLDISATGKKDDHKADIGGNIAPRERLLIGHLPYIGISWGILKSLFGTLHGFAD